MAVAVQNGLVASPLLRAGTDEQKARWLPGLASGELIGRLRAHRAGRRVGHGLPAHPRRARPTTAGWSISGAKQWITNGGFADLFVIFARTGGPGARGVSAFVSELGAGFDGGPRDAEDGPPHLLDGRSWRSTASASGPTGCSARRARD